MEDTLIAPGFLLPTRELMMAQEGLNFRQIDLVEQAEPPRFDSVWAGDSGLAAPGSRR